MKPAGILALGLIVATPAIPAAEPAAPPGSARGAAADGVPRGGQAWLKQHLAAGAYEHLAQRLREFNDPAVAAALPGWRFFAIMIPAYPVAMLPPARRGRDAARLPVTGPP